MNPADTNTGRGLRKAFTLIELLVSMVVLVLLIMLVSQLVGSAVSVITSDFKHIEADEQARVLFERMSVDVANLVKRGDVDYLLKQSPLNQTGNKQPGNDQMAFYSEVPGYYPLTGAQSPVSLVAYRVNNNSNSANYQKVERLGKGLVWNGVSTADSPVLLLPVPLASPLASPLPSPMPASLPTPAWPQAGSSTMEDPDFQYELLGPQIFRLEYYYLLKGQTVNGIIYPSLLSDTPWDARIAGHENAAGLRDVAAIAVAVAIIDPKSHVLVTDAQLATLGTLLGDFQGGYATGELEARWQTAVNSAGGDFPPAARRSVRIYHRYFYLNLPQ